MDYRGFYMHVGEDLGYNNCWGKSHRTLGRAIAWARNSILGEKLSLLEIPSLSAFGLHKHLFLGLISPEWIVPLNCELR